MNKNRNNKLLTTCKFANFFNFKDSNLIQIYKSKIEKCSLRFTKNIKFEFLDKIHDNINKINSNVFIL